MVEPVAVEPELEPEPDTGEASLLAQLEEQWAKLAAAEEALAERERELAELAERERELTELAESREREVAGRPSAANGSSPRLAQGRERELAERAERERKLRARPRAENASSRSCARDPRSRARRTDRA